MRIYRTYSPPVMRTFLFLSLFAPIYSTGPSLPSSFVTSLDGAIFCSKLRNYDCQYNSDFGKKRKRKKKEESGYPGLFWLWLAWGGLKIFSWLDIVCLFARIFGQLKQKYTFKDYEPCIYTYYDLLVTSKTTWLAPSSLRQLSQHRSELLKT